MNRPLLLFAVLVLVFGLKGCSFSDDNLCRDSAFYSDPGCFNVKYLIGNADSTIMFHRLMYDTSKTFHVNFTYSCEDYFASNSIGAEYSRTLRSKEFSIYIGELNRQPYPANTYQASLYQPKSRGFIVENTMFCSNYNENDTARFICKMLFYLSSATQNRFHFKGQSPNQNHELIFTRDEDISCYSR